MNPNMTYAQLIPGRTTVRGTGIIDARRFCYAFSAAALLRGSAGWSDADERGLQKWAGDFLHWLNESEHGRPSGYVLFCGIRLPFLFFYLIYLV